MKHWKFFLCIIRMRMRINLEKKIKAIRSDRGGEYDAPFDRFC